MISISRWLLIAVVLSAGAADAQRRDDRGRGRPEGPASRYADPSGVISAEILVNRLAVERGRWTALARTGARDAILFVPRPVYAQPWLKGQRGAAPSIRWQTRRVFMSCDGNAALTTGQWVQSDGLRGAYSNVWRRDAKAGFQWILSNSGGATRPAEPTDEIDARVAYCRRSGGGRPYDAAKRNGAHDAAVVVDIRQPAPMNGEGRSPDGSLRWTWVVAPDGSRTLNAWMATETGETQILADEVPAP